MTKILRESGTMNGMITTKEYASLDEVLPRIKAYATGKVVERVTCKEKKVLENDGLKVPFSIWARRKTSPVRFMREAAR